MTNGGFLLILLVSVKYSDQWWFVIWNSGYYTGDNGGMVTVNDNNCLENVTFTNGSFYFCYLLKKKSHNGAG